MKNFIKDKTENIKDTVKSLARSNEIYLNLESIEVIDERIFLKFVNSESKEVYIEVTEQLNSIVEDSEKLNNTNIQKIYRELPRVFEGDLNENNEVYLEKFLLYKELYKACSSVLIAKREVYPK